jgi:hypothetical protein
MENERWVSVGPNETVAAIFRTDEHDVEEVTVSGTTLAGILIRPKMIRDDNYEENSRVES